MGADAGIISSFEKLANANKVDYRGQLQAQQEQGKIISQGIANTAGIIAKGIQDKQTKEDAENKAINVQKRKNINENDKKFSKRSDEVNAALNNDGGIGDWFSDSVYDEIDRIQREEFEPYNTGENTPDNTKGKQKAMGAQSQITNQVVNFRTDLLKITEGYGTASGPSRISPSMSEEDRNFIQAIIGEDDNRDNVTPRWEDKVLYFDVVTPGYFDPISQTQITEDTVRSEKASDLMSIYKEKNIKGETAIVASQGAAQKWGNNADNKNVEYDVQMEADNIKTSIFEGEGNTVEGFGDLAQRRLPGQPTTKAADDTSKWEAGSWAYSLQEHPSLNKAVYDAVNVVVDTGGGTDGGPDGIVSPAEAKAVMDGKNRDIVISAMVDPTALGFDFDLSATEYSMFLAEGNKQAAEAARTAKFGKVTKVEGKLNEKKEE